MNIYITSKLEKGLHDAHLFRVAGRTYSVYTDYDYRYNYTWLRPTTSHVTFRAKACKDIHVLLASDLQETAVAYEVVIGGYNNERVDIRRGAQGPVLAETWAIDICNCNEYLPFWISWENKTIEVGTGKLRQHILLSVSDLEEGHEVKAVSLSTYHDSQGEYQLPQEHCEYIYMCVYPTLCVCIQHCMCL